MKKYQKMGLVAMLLIILFASSLELSAKAKGSLSGKVLSDGDSQEIIIGATLRLKGTSIGTYTNKEGKFLFKNIPIGKYTILASAVGFELKSYDLEIVQDKTIEIELILNTKTLLSKEIVVTANKKIQAVQEVPISISILDGKIFTERAISTLDEALRYVQGVEVKNDDISIRGSSGFAFGLGSRALLLLDGFPMLSGDNGDIKSDVLPVALIEQVEVVKGAGSALYGASALGGVINIITREAREKPYFVANTYTGIYTEPKYDSWIFSENYQAIYGMNFAYSKKFSKLGLSFAGSSVRDEGYTKYNDQTRNSIYSKLNYEFSSSTDLILSALVGTNDRADWVYWNSLDSATRPPSNTDINNRLRSNKYNLFTEMRHIISNKHFIVARTGFFITTLENDLTGADYRQSTASTLNTEIQSNSIFSNYFALTLGFNHVYTSVSAKIYGNRSQNTVSLYSQMETKLDPVVLTYGFRIDNEHTNGIKAKINSIGLPESFQISPKFALSYKTDYQTNIRFSTGTGFRPASVAERFAAVRFQGFEVVPNIDLKAEKSWSFEIGVNQPLEFFDNPFIFDISFYNNELYDMIEPKFVQGTTPSIKFLNTTRARVTGIELNIKTLLEKKLGIELGISAMKPLDIDSNQVLKYRSSFLFLSKLFYMLGDFEIFADYNFKSKPEKVDDELKLQINDHSARVPIHVLDLGVKYKMYDYLPIDITISAQNLLDYYYAEVPGNLGKTRAIILQIGYRL